MYTGASFQKATAVGRISVQESPSNSTEDAAENKKVAVFDLDGTLTFKDTYVQFLLFCFRKYPTRLLRGVNLVVYLVLYKSGLRSNHWLKARYLKTVAAGIPPDKFDRLCEEFCQLTIEDNIKPKAMIEINRLRQAGYVLVLATASFDFYVSRLFELLKMDHLLCTASAVDGAGCITGEIDGKNCIGSEKARRVAALVEISDWSGVDSAYSDDRVDMPLFEMAGTAFVVDPDPSTESLANQRNFQVLNWR